MQPFNISEICPKHIQQLKKILFKIKIFSNSSLTRRDREFSGPSYSVTVTKLSMLYYAGLWEAVASGRGSEDGGLLSLNSQETLYLTKSK